MTRAQRNAKRREQAIAKANAAIPGSASFARIDDNDDPSPVPFAPTDNIIFPHCHLLASMEETTEAFRGVCDGPEGERNLREANIGWGGSADDSMLSALIAPPARYAVKHNLSLTTPLTKQQMTRSLTPDDAGTFLNTMENTWGGCFPLNYTIEQLPNDTRFAHAKDELPSSILEEAAATPNPSAPPVDSRKCFRMMLSGAAMVLLHNKRIPFPLTEE